MLPMNPKGPTLPPAVAIYCRVSTEDQTCNLQLDACREFALNRGWRIFAEYVDTGISGTKASRPQLNKLMLDSRARRFDCVLVWKLDRFGRSVANFVKHIEDLRNWGVRFICTSQQIDTDEGNPAARLLMHIFAAFAEFERCMISERVTAGLKAAKHRGVRIGRPRVVYDRQKVIDLHTAGKSREKIAAELGINRGVVYRTLRDLPGSPRAKTA